MKKSNYIVAISFLVAILAVIAIFEYEKPVPTISKESAESDNTDHLFRGMGIARGDPTPVPLNLGLQDLNGRTVELSDFKGKIVFLNFWASWCQSCRDEMPSMQKLYSKFKITDFAMLAVNLQESASTVRDFLTTQNLAFVALLDSDGKARSSFGVGTIPTTLILDKKGRIISRAVGPREWDSKESFALFEYLVSEGADPAS